MKRYTFRTVAVAAALLGTGWYAMAQGDGAFAQDAAPQAAQTVAADTVIQAEETPKVRFVAEPVVQEIPAEEPAETPEAVEFRPQDHASLSEVMAATPHDGEMSADMDCLARAVYFESRGEPLAGQLAVATVIVNRAESSRFPDTYCGVVKQRSQFSFVKRGQLPQPQAGAAWNKARKIARIAHRDTWQSEADDSLYFHATYVKPRWASRMTMRAKIDTHLFYR